MSYTTQQIIRQQAAMIVPHLPTDKEPWRVDTEWEPQHNARVTGPGGAILFLSRDKDRLVISSGYPYLERGEYGWPHDLNHLKITVAADTDPAKVARAITSRLLPNYWPELARVHAEHERVRAARGSAEITRKVLTEHGVTFHRDGSRGDKGYLRITLNHDGTSASLDSLMLPIETVLQIVDLIEP